MEDPRLLQNEVRPGESVADVLTRQMRELGARSYWEAVHLQAQREAQRARTNALISDLFGF